MKDKINILTIDGGGIRGIIPALILAEIEKQAKKPISELFDIIAGTSTGGILALGLTVAKKGTQTPKFSAQDLANLYSEQGNRIFYQPAWRKILGKIDDLLDNTYNHEGIEKLLEEYFEDSLLSQSLTQVLVTAYDIEARESFIFNSRLANDPDPQTAKKEDFLISEVARSTSAAPTYFEPKLIGADLKRRAMVDGGVFANNPSLIAYTEAMQLLDWNKSKTFEMGTMDTKGVFIKPRDIDEPIFMLSLGTGTAQKHYSYDEAKDWGYVGWLRPIIEIMMQGNSDSVHYQMERLLPPRMQDNSSRYERFNIVDMQDKHTAMDKVNSENIEALKAYATKFIKSSPRRINSVIKELTS